jgi:hypothetical protein
MKKILIGYSAIACCLQLAIFGAIGLLSPLERYARREMYTRTVSPLLANASIFISPYLWIVSVAFGILCLAMWFRKSSEQSWSCLLGAVLVSSLVIVLMTILGFAVLTMHQEMGGLSGS